MIDKKNLIYIGYISRPHSFRGEVQVTLERKIVSLDRDDFLFFKLDGHYIPNKIVGIKGRPDEPIIQFEFVENHNQALDLAGTEIYTDCEVLPKDSELSFIGFEVIDKHLGTIGIVEDVQELPQQLMLLVPFNGEVRYIPLVEDFIDDISEDNKEIRLTLPKGLLEL